MMRLTSGVTTHSIGEKGFRRYERIAASRLIWLLCHNISFAVATSGLSQSFFDASQFRDGVCREL